VDNPRAGRGRRRCPSRGRCEDQLATTRRATARERHRRTQRPGTMLADEL
jgi:hypothetical protein